MTMAIGNESEKGAALGSVEQAAADQLVEAGLLDELMSRVDAGEVQPTGRTGLVPVMIKAVLERVLEAELSGHPGYEKGNPAGGARRTRATGRPRGTVAIEVGDVVLAAPQDRVGTFELRLVPKGARRVGGLDEMGIELRVAASAGVAVDGERVLGDLLHRADRLRYQSKASGGGRTVG